MACRRGRRAPRGRSWSPPRSAAPRSRAVPAPLARPSAASHSTVFPTPASPSISSARAPSGTASRNRCTCCSSSSLPMSSTSMTVEAEPTPEGGARSGRSRGRRGTRRCARRRSRAGPAGTPPGLPLQTSVMAKKMLCDARSRLSPGILASSARAYCTLRVIPADATLSRQVRAAQVVRVLLELGLPFGQVDDAGLAARSSAASSPQPVATAAQSTSPVRILDVVMAHLQVHRWVRRAGPAPLAQARSPHADSPRRPSRPDSASTRWRQSSSSGRNVERTMPTRTPSAMSESVARCRRLTSAVSSPERERGR